MTGNQTTCGQFFSYQSGWWKKNWTAIHLLSLELSLNSINTFYVLPARQLKSQNYVLANKEYCPAVQVFGQPRNFARLSLRYSCFNKISKHVEFLTYHIKYHIHHFYENYYFLIRSYCWFIADVLKVIAMFIKLADEGCSRKPIS
jgi:hypothetical protein